MSTGTLVKLVSPAPFSSCVPPELASTCPVHQQQSIFLETLAPFLPIWVARCTNITLYIHGATSIGSPVCVHGSGCCLCIRSQRSLRLLPAIKGTGHCDKDVARKINDGQLCLELGTKVAKRFQWDINRDRKYGTQLTVKPQ